MTRLFHILAILALVTLGLSPIASAASHCPMGMADQGMAMDEQMPCCPDMVPGDACQTGCVQLVVAPVPAPPGKLPQHAHYGMAAAAVGAEWIAPRETEPPRMTLRS